MSFTLTEKQILEALTELARRCAALELRVGIYVVGGAAIALSAARGARDRRDIIELVRALNVRTLERAEEILDSYFPQEILSPRATAAVKAAFAAPAG